MNERTFAGAVTVLSVSWHSAARLRYLFDNLTKKAANAQAIAFLIVDNTGGTDDAIAAFARESSRIRLVSFDGRGLQPSIAHASGLERGLAAVDTEYVLIVDPDVHVFLPRWDAHCAEWLSAHDAVAIGAPYPFWKLGKYHDFPSPIFCFARTASLRDLGNDWQPFHASRAGRTYSFVARKVVRLGPLGSKARLQRDGWIRNVTGALERLIPESGPDTGYRMAKRARALQVRSVVFEAACADSLKASAPSEGALEELATQYELYTFEGKAVLTHQYSSGSYHWRTERGKDADHWLRRIRAVENSG